MRILKILIQAVVVVLAAAGGAGAQTDGGKVEEVTLHIDNGRGGIRRVPAVITLRDGQYCAEVKVRQPGGRVAVERWRVSRVRDSARLLYHTDSWAAPYSYVAERGSLVWDPRRAGYFNMRSAWRPPLTADSPYEDGIKPLGKIKIYLPDARGGRTVSKGVVMEYGGQRMLYVGDDSFASLIERNDTPEPYDPQWAEAFRWRALVSGRSAFFNFP